MGIYGVINGIAFILLVRRAIIALNICPYREEESQKSFGKILWEQFCFLGDAALSDMLFLF